MLPSHNKKFQTYYAPAYQTRQLWRLLCGVLLIVVLYFAFTFLFSFIISRTAAPHQGGDILLNIVNGTQPKYIILLLSTFVFLFVSVLVAAKIFHKRGLRSLLGPDLTKIWRGFWIGAGILSALSLITAAVFSVFKPPIENMAFWTWLPWVLLALPFLLIQVSAEELLFRGYLQQQLAARFASRWMWWVLPSTIFGALHYDPETMGSNAWIVVAHTALFGLIAADITARTGNLGTAIGLHFANNLMALTVIVLDGSLSGLGLYKTAFHVSDEAFVKRILIVDLIFVASLYGLFLIWARNKFQE